MTQLKPAYALEDKVDILLDDVWLPALIKGIRPVGDPDKDGNQTFVYTVQPDLAGQPAATGRPNKDLAPQLAVAPEALRGRGGEVVVPKAVAKDAAPADAPAPAKKAADPVTAAPADAKVVDSPADTKAK
jgi:hypothetical protein